MRVLMFGWEFPPFNKGGLGTACLGLTKGLANSGVQVTFVVPKAPKGLRGEHQHCEVVVASNVRETINGVPVEFAEVHTLLAPYITQEEYLKRYAAHKQNRGIIESEDGSDDDVYGTNLYDEVIRYTNRASLLAQTKQFDVIHCHDWMTYKAGIVAKRMSGKPLVLHIHATEFDRTGGNGVNQMVYDIEREGFESADKIFAVSQRTKDTVVYHYGIDPSKVEVVYNAVEFMDGPVEHVSKISQKDKIVLFLGRITLQKGPDYFVEAAARVLKHQPDTTFVVAGSGDMEYRMIDRAAELGIANKMLFTGFLRGKDIDKAYAMADLYVMPSVSEPFGITPLEAMRNNTPVLVSKQSGVSEVISHALKCDFWDINQMANKMISVLRYPSLHGEIQKNGSAEVRKFSWNKVAQQCKQQYQQVIDMHTLRQMGNNAGGALW